MKSILFFTTIATPFGPLSLAVDSMGALIASVFGPVSLLRSRLPSSELSEGPARTSEARRQVEAYLRNPGHRFDLALAPSGTAFQQRVWSALRAIPAGRTRSYGALAAELASSPRAIGGANARNPICLFIPCHRVIGADGSLTGFAFGETIKRGLLAHERAAGFAPPQAA